jgi:MFS family permease
MSQTALDAATFVLTAIVAARSTWSPCGISMLSTLTPLGERSRGHRYAATATWFVAGATIGGACLGAVMAGLAAAVHWAAPSPQQVTAVVVAAAALTVASDLRVGGFRLPTIPRQVDETWIGRYRPWVYASGFGWQIGAGLTTYVMTAGVYLLVALAALTGRPLLALAIGTGFGLLRGLAILCGAGLTTAAAVRGFHARFETAAPLSLAIAVVAQLDVAIVALGWATPVLLALVGVAVVVRFALWRRRSSDEPAR